MRKLALGIVLVCLMATSVQAGLQSALQAIQIQPIQSIYIGRSIYPSLPPIPEGALFIDPIASTLGEGVFREGPDFVYDPTTGGVTVFAPPMLGPADEFGVRQQYSPQSMRIVGRDFFANAPSIPQLATYSRNATDTSLFYLRRIPIVPLGDDDPSFVVTTLSNNFSLSISSDNIQVSLGYSGRITGAEISFSSLLMPGLEADVFDAEMDTLLPNSIWPYFPNVDDALPEVQFVIDYRADYSVSDLGLPRSYSLLAVPQIGNAPGSIPEPSSVLLTCLMVFVLLTRRPTRDVP